MSLILRVGWVWTLEKYVTKFYVTNWEGRVGLNPNMYNVTLFSLFFFEGFPNVQVVSFTISTLHAYFNSKYHKTKLSFRF